MCVRSPCSVPFLCLSKRTTFSRRKGTHLFKSGRDDLRGLWLGGAKLWCNPQAALSRLLIPAPVQAGLWQCNVLCAPLDACLQTPLGDLWRLSEKACDCWSGGPGVEAGVFYTCSSLEDEDEVSGDGSQLTFKFFVWLWMMDCFNWWFPASDHMRDLHMHYRFSLSAIIFHCILFENHVFTDSHGYRDRAVDFVKRILWPCWTLLHKFEFTF